MFPHFPAFACTNIPLHGVRYYIYRVYLTPCSPDKDNRTSLDVVCAKDRCLQKKKVGEVGTGGGGYWLTTVFTEGSRYVCVCNDTVSINSRCIVSHHDGGEAVSIEEADCKRNLIKQSGSLGVGGWCCFVERGQD